MPREKDGYRENLEILNVRFPEHDMLSVEEVKQVTGFSNIRTVKKYFGQYFVGNRISKTYVARGMCAE